MLSPFDLAQYGIAVIFIVLLGTSAFEKFKSLSVPDWFLQQFAKSFLGPYPTLIKISYWKIAFFEALLTLGFVAGLFSVVILSYTLACAVFLFAALCFGLRISYDYQGSANMFTYFSATLLSLIAVLTLSR